MPTTAADAIIIERAEADFEEGLAHARARIRERHGRLAAMSLDGLVMGAVNVLNLRGQLRDDVKLLLDLAHRVDGAEDARKLAQENLERVLRLRQKMHFLAREGDPQFQRVLDVARENFALRLPDLARMATVRDPADYDDLVRKAFPERAHVERIVHENRAFTLEILDHLEKHPHVLRIPAHFVPKIAEIARDMIEWQTARVLAGVEDIYAAR